MPAAKEEGGPCRRKDKGKKHWNRQQGPAQIEGMSTLLLWSHYDPSRSMVRKGRDPSSEPARAQHTARQTQNFWTNDKCRQPAIEYTYTHTCTCACISTSFMYIYLCICICMYMSVYMHVQTYVHIHVHLHMQACVHSLQTPKTALQDGGLQACIPGTFLWVLHATLRASYALTLRSSSTLRY